MGLFTHRERDLFSVRTRVSKDKPNKKRKKQKTNEDDDGGPRKRARYNGLRADDMQPITYQSITAGQVILGCVQEVRDYELVISLPHLLMGRVTVARISKTYSSLLTKVAETDGDVGEKVHTLKELYLPGQYVVTRVVSTEEVNNRIKVNLTLMPQEVNFGISPSFLEVGHVIVCAVSSVEDNGYVMDTGIHNVRAAFLKNTLVEGSGIVGVGSVIRCVITKIMGNSEQENTVRLKLSADARAVSGATLDLSDTTNRALLLPGTAINTTVSKIHKLGVKVLLADVDGVVSRLHLETPFSQSSQYELATKVRARVLYVMPLTKVVHLTLQPSVCAKSPEPDPLHGLKVGERVEQAEIYESKKSGVYLKLSEKCRGFCSCNHLTDSGKTPTNLQRTFPVGAKRMCRIIKYNYMDQLFIVSLQKSIMEQQTIGYQELKAGQVLKATVKNYGVHGAEVAVSKFVSGQIPYVHLTDSRMQDPKKKYNIGDIVKARVLKVIPQKRHMLLTCKKQLVEYEGDIITEFKESYVGMETRGCIVSILKAGLLINLYNDVKGFAPKTTTKATKYDKLDDVYEVGQVVDCKVLKVFPEKLSMTLSLHTNKKNKQHVKKKQSLPVNEDLKEPKPVNKDMEEPKPVNEALEEPVEITDENAEKSSKKAEDNASEEPTNILEEETPSLDNKKNKRVMKEKSKPVYELVEQETITREVVNIPSPDKKNKKVNEKNKVVDVKSEPMEVTEEVVNTPSCDDKKNKKVKKQQSKPVCEESEEQEITEEVVNTPSLDKKKNKKVKKEQSNPVGEELDDQEEVTEEISIARSLDKKNKKVKKEKNTPEEQAETIEKIVSTPSLDKKKNEKVKEKSKPVGEESEEPADITKKTVNTPSPDKKNRKIKEKSTPEEPTEIIEKIVHTLTPDKNDKKIKKEKSTPVGKEPEEQETIYEEVVNSSNPGKRKNKKVRKEKSMPMGEESVVSNTPSLHNKKNKKVKEKNNPLGVESEEPAEITEKIENTSSPDKMKNLKVKKEIRLSVGEESEVSNTPSLDKKKNKKGKGKRKLVGEESEEPAEIVEKTINTQSSNKKSKKIKKEISMPVGMKLEQVETPGKSPKKKKEKKSKKRSEEEEIDHGDSGVEEMDVKEEEEEEEEKSTISKKKKLLSLGTGFVWDVPETTDTKALSSDEDSDDDAGKKKKTKRLSKAERIAAAKEEERRLHQLECARLDDNRNPQTALDFEELLQRTPNSSTIWIQFISFHLENAEVEQAKAVARRALQVINPQEEEERLNLWTVLLRLEVTYGTPEEVAKAYTEAQANCDQLKVQMAMAMVYAEANKYQEAEKVYYVMSKKYSQVLDVWVKAGIYFFSHKKADEARRYMERALLSLNVKHHVELINRFGQLEFRFGEAERGRTIFESLLSNYPKRIDVWSVYVDILTKHGDYEGARHVLERMTGLKLRLRKMRFVFKKFLEFEKAHGTSQSVEAVKKRVEEFVASALQQEA